MVALSRPPSHQDRREWWRRQLARRQSANQSVAEFCRQLGVSVTTFYYWKKRIHEVASHPPGQVAAESPSRPVTTAASFVPVSLVELGAGAQLEIELANACVVRLKGAIDPSLLQTAISAAGQLHGPRRGAN
jgi:Transposase